MSNSEDHSSELPVAKSLFLDLIKGRQISITFIVVAATFVAGVLVDRWIFQDGGPSYWMALLQIALMELIIGVSVAVAGNLNERMMSLHREAIEQIKEGSRGQSQLKRSLTDLCSEFDSFRNSLFKYAKILDHVDRIDDVTTLEDLATVALSVEELRHHSPLLSSVAKRELKQVAQDFRQMSVGATYVKRTRLGNQEVQKIFKYLMESIPDGCHYDTISYLDFWSSKVLSDTKDFLLTNITASKRVKIQRVFLLSREIQDLTDQEQELLRGHRSATEKSNGRIRTRIFIKKKLLGMLEQSDNFAICSHPEAPSLLIKMEYALRRDGTRGELDRVEIVVDEQECENYRAEFEQVLAESQDISEFDLGP